MITIVEKYPDSDEEDRLINIDYIPREGDHVILDGEEYDVIGITHDFSFFGKQNVKVRVYRTKYHSFKDR